MPDTDQPNQNYPPAPPDTPKRGKINWTLIQSIGIPFVTLLSGFWIGYQGIKNTKQAQIDASKTQQAQYEDEIRKERIDFLQKCVPQLMSKDSDERRTAEALLYALSMEEGPDADQVLEIIEHYEPKSNIISDTAISNQQWGIVLSDSPDSSSAVADVKNAHERGFTSVRIIRDSANNQYRTIISGYHSKAAAMSQSFLARAALSDGARVEKIDSLLKPVNPQNPVRLPNSVNSSRKDSTPKTK